MSIVVSNGCGTWTIDDGHELWRLMWAAVGFAIVVSVTGACPACGCSRVECEYCLHECYVDGPR